jgi:hypothetical protein
MVNLKELKVQYISDDSGARTGVVLPIHEFQELLEDIEDLAALAERHDEPTLSHEALLAELKRDGIL